MGAEPESKSAAVLIVSPQEAARRRLRLALRRAGFDCWVVSWGHVMNVPEQFLGAASLLVVDVPHYDADLAMIARKVRAMFDGPIMLLCHPLRAEEQDRAECLEAGADDCLSRTASARLLAATALARLRPAAEGVSVASADDGNLVRVGGLVIDRGGRRVTVDGREARLTPKELQLLLTLASRPGRPISPEWLLRLLWGLAPGCRSRTVHVHIRRLRKKLERDPRVPQLIVTRRGFGYELRAL